jgi:glycosyltransferase involved in cell wall biosynthesis
VSVEFTVGIPTHNRRETALLALASALEQTRAPARIYVVADGCTDGTQEAAGALGEERVEVLDRPKGFGCGYAHRNEVLERAGSGAVAWLADDDLWLPDHLERAGELLDAGVAGIVNSMACLVREDGALEPFGVHWRAPTYGERFQSTENRTPSSAVSHLAQAALDAGGWPEDFERGGDWDLWKRMVRAWERKQSWADRVAQNAGFLARLRDPAQLAQLRGEIAFACSASAHADATSLHEAYEREALHRHELAAVGAERERLAGELEAITSGTWWRLRRPFEPALQLRRRLRKRGERSV